MKIPIEISIDKIKNFSLSIIFLKSVKVKQ